MMLDDMLFLGIGLLLVGFFIIVPLLVIVRVAASPGTKALAIVNVLVFDCLLLTLAMNQFNTACQRMHKGIMLRRISRILVDCEWGGHDVPQETRAILDDWLSGRHDKIDEKLYELERQLSDEAAQRASSEVEEGVENQDTGTE